MVTVGISSEGRASTVLAVGTGQISSGAIQVVQQGQEAKGQREVRFGFIPPGWSSVRRFGGGEGKTGTESGLSE